jgi:hypothetical protein
LEKWVPEAGRESVRAMMEEGKRELEKQSKLHITAKSVAARLHTVDQVI